MEAERLQMVGDWRGPFLSVGLFSRFERGGRCPLWARVCPSVDGGFRFPAGASRRPVREVRK